LATEAEKGLTVEEGVCYTVESKEAFDTAMLTTLSMAPVEKNAEHPFRGEWSPSRIKLTALSLSYPSATMSTTAIATETSTTMKKRCECCRLKLPLTAFPCRCGGYYCSQHRADVEHKCSYDYRCDSMKALSTLLVKVESQKLERL
jgi:hypothetical protein